MCAAAGAGNERRRAVLLDAIRRHLPADAQVGGTAAGLHVVLWLPFLLPQDEVPLAAAARAGGVGIYPVSPLFAKACPDKGPRPAGWVLGYASLTPEQIDDGVRRLAAVVASWTAAPSQRRHGR